MGSLWEMCQGAITHDVKTVKLEIKNLLCCAITCNPDSETTRIRMSKLRYTMRRCREASLAWDNLLQSSLTFDNSCCITVYHVLKRYGGCRDVIAMWVLCTYVTDMCVLSMARGKEVVVSDVVGVLVNFLVEADIDLCIKFLHTIDAM